MIKCKHPKALASLLAVGFGLLALSACGTDDTTYTYFVVSMKVDPATVDVDTLRKVSGCVLSVEMAAHAQVEVPCSFMVNNPNHDNYNLGAADYSTNLTEGSLQFVLTLYNLNHQKIAEGKSDPKGIVPGETITTAVVAKLVEPPAM